MMDYCTWCGDYAELVDSVQNEHICLDCRFEPDYLEHVSRVMREARRRDRLKYGRDAERNIYWWNTL